MKLSDQFGREAASAGGTRERVARLIGERGPVTASALAGELGMTAAAVRRHVEAMLGQGLVVPFSASRTGSRGRPATSYVLTAAGHARLRDTYQDLAASALEFLADSMGPAGVQDFAERRASSLVQRYQPAVEAAGGDPRQRTQALAAALSDDGFAATARVVRLPEHASSHTGQSGVIQLCQGHCPVYRVAEQYPQLCQAELNAFSALLGLPVRRLATLAAGDHVCTTHVSTTAVIDSAPPSRGSHR